MPLVPCKGQLLCDFFCVHGGVWNWNRTLVHCSPVHNSMTNSCMVFLQKEFRWAYGHSLFFELPIFACHTAWCHYYLYMLEDAVSLGTCEKFLLKSGGRSVQFGSYCSYRIVARITRNKIARKVNSKIWVWVICEFCLKCGFTAAYP